MSDEEAAADNIPSPDSSEDNSFYGTKQQSKLIRILTVLAYVLSVSLAAILLSIYYIFMWDGRPQLGPQIQQISPQPLKDLPMKIGGGARENDTVMIEESDFNVKEISQRLIAAAPTGYEDLSSTTTESNTELTTWSEFGPEFMKRTLFRQKLLYKHVNDIIKK